MSHVKEERVGKCVHSTVLQSDAFELRDKFLMERCEHNTYTIGVTWGRGDVRNALRRFFFYLRIVFGGAAELKRGT